MNNAVAPAYDLEEDYSERRTGERHISVLRVGRVIWDGNDQLCVVRNLSAGGLMFDCLYPPTIGQVVTLELRSDKQMIGTVRWVKGSAAGIAFDRPVNVEAILREERSSLLRVRPRAPRFVRRGTIKLIGEGEPIMGDIIDISIGGLSCRSEEPLMRGEPIVVVLEGVGATNAEVRWVKGDAAGIRFDKPLPWRAFQEWLDQAPRA
ncbi:PilZ domain-containing protein [Sphingomonas tabacisoli]|uniref:PilZ domain-containing protein n=1 Tax=Sphingomonas tabacisoli TaxID=2249466 RepID=A0ABW4I5Q9_9SPHN